MICLDRMVLARSWRYGDPVVSGNPGPEDVPNKMCEWIYCRRLVLLYVCRRYL